AIKLSLLCIISCKTESNGAVGKSFRTCWSLDLCVKEIACRNPEFTKVSLSKLYIKLSLLDNVKGLTREFLSASWRKKLLVCSGRFKNTFSEKPSLFLTEK